MEGSVVSVGPVGKRGKAYRVAGQNLAEMGCLVLERRESDEVARHVCL